MSKYKKLTLVLAVIFIAVCVLLRFMQGVYVLPVLMYHSVNPQAAPENGLAVTVKSFERQIKFLRDHKYNILPLEIAGKLVKEKKPIPPRTVVLTFDDGYIDNYTYVFPILKKYNVPASFFLIFNEVGRPDRLSWGMVREMQGSGLAFFGSHALGPEPLVNIESETELRRQIFGSKLALEKKLGNEVTSFSYPEGRFTDKIRQLVVDAGYKVAVATNPGKGFSSNDAFALKRLRISANCDNFLAFWIETSGYYNFIREHRHKRGHKNK